MLGTADTVAIPMVNPRVLLVDDDHVDRMTVRRALERSGLSKAELHESTDLPSALRMLSGDVGVAFDCVLLDYDLASDSGTELLRTLRARRVDVPVVVLTDHTTPEVAAALIKEGAADFITKDAMAPARLEQAVRGAMRVAAAERETRAVQERLAITLAGIADAVLTVDADGRIVYMNPAAERFTGFGAQEAMGRLLEEVANVDAPERRIGRGSRDLLHERVREVIDGLRPHERADMTLTTREGDTLVVDATVTPLRGASGLGSGAVIALRDITQRKRAEAALAEANHRLQEQAVELEQQVEESQALAEELERANEHLQELNEEAERARREAEEANRAKSEFLASMSHELRTPLNAIGGYADLLLAGVRGTLNDAQCADVQRIQRSQHHLLSLINDILNFAKLEAGRVRFDLEEVPMHDVLERLEELIAPQLLQKGLHYEYRACDPRLIGYVDEERLQQIMLNLLSNAIKFTPEGGRILVTCEGSEQDILVAVHDTGIGIPSDKVEHIFEPFVQLDRGQATGNVGTGLGLAISRDLARAMSGDLTAHENEDGGATFRLRLPRRR